LLGGIAAAAWLPQVRIHSIAVSGQKTVEGGKLQAFVEEKISGRRFVVLPADSVFLYPKKEIATELLAYFPLLKTATVHAQNFESIAVEVSEREPYALWCGATPLVESPCALMDKTGLAYAPAANFFGDAYFTYYGPATTSPGFKGAFAPRQFLTPQEFESLSALVEQFAKYEQKARVNRVVVEEVGDVKLSFDNGFSLLFALKDATGDVFESFVLALTAEPFVNRPISDFEYLDLRFGDKLYYHLKNK
jgi:hypothetical protein